MAEHKKYDIKLVFEPTRDGMVMMNYDSMARNRQELVDEILHYLTIQIFEAGTDNLVEEVDNA